MRFWQKTYIFTLILFLLCLNGGIMSLAVYTYRQNVEATEATVTAEQYYISRSFERDHTDLMSAGGNTSPTLLMQSYGNHYKSKGIFFAFEKEGKQLYSNFSEPFSVNDNTLVHKKLDGKRYVFITSTLCDGEYRFVFAKNVEQFDEEFSSLMFVYSLTALAVSALLALCLFFILKRLSVPLDKLRNATEKIEGGDFSVTVEEQGKDEFSLLAKSFNSMLDKINEQMTALETDAEKKQMLVDNMAHELRTPLTSIQGYAEYLEKAAVTEENRILAAKYIISESARLKRISDILLDTAYIRGNTVVTSSVDLADVLNDTADRLRPKAKNCGVTLLTATESTVVNGDGTLLSMLFYNLTENAVKACDEGGVVKLCCTDKTVTVKDNGKGMTPEQLSHITEPFYRTDRSRSRAEGGAGLGLALCKQIALSHNASISFESRLGEGTEITVSFTS